MEKLKLKRNLKWLWAVLLIAVIIALCVILIVNHSYVYDPYGTDYILQPNEKGTLTLYYNGAEGYPDSDTITYNAYEKIELPTLEKEGYNFIGWSNYGAFTGTEITMNSKGSSVSALFTKDFSNIKSPIAIYADENNYDEFNIGEYPSVSYENFKLYIDGGYKLHTYSKENFGGIENIYVYSSLSKGNFYVIEDKIKSIKYCRLKVKRLLTVSLIIIKRLNY